MTFKKRTVPNASRRALALRYGCRPGGEARACCAYCRTKGGTITWWSLSNGRPSGWVSFTDLEIDHVIPEFLGGSSSPDNLTLACRRCNRRKGYRLCASAQ